MVFYVLFPFFLFFFFLPPHSMWSFHGAPRPGIRPQPQSRPKLQLKQHGILNPLCHKLASQHSQDTADLTASQWEFQHFLQTLRTIGLGGSLTPPHPPCLPDLWLGVAGGKHSRIGQGGHPAEPCWEKKVEWEKGHWLLLVLVPGAPVPKWPVHGPPNWQGPSIFSFCHEDLEVLRI